MEEWCNGAYFGRDNCPVTLYVTYDLLVRRFGKFTTDKREVSGWGRGNGWGGCGINFDFMHHGTANEDNIKPVKYVTTINI